MKKLLERLKRIFSRSAIELQKKPLNVVQRPTNPDDSVMLHTNTDLFYLDPRVERDE